MKWYTLPKIDPALNTERIKRKFLFMPREFNNENRWLCFCDIVERYEVQKEWIPDVGIFPIEGWYECGFADSEYRTPLRDFSGRVIFKIICESDKPDVERQMKGR